MSKHNIAVIPGDGIGIEVIDIATKVLEASGLEFNSKTFDLGGARYLKDGEILSDETLDKLKNYEAILLGAVGHPDVTPGVIERGLLLKMRFDFDQYINLRPFISDVSPSGQKVDIICVRENTEGPYVGEGGVLKKGTVDEVATQGSVNTRKGVERTIRYAFELARVRDRKHLTMVHKINVLNYSGDLWNRTFTEVAKEYDDVSTSYCHIDAACIYFVQDPSRFDVVVTDNLFGDILTDLGGAISGGIGRAASANLNPTRTTPSMFEPVHGSAPDIAGKNIADPRAAITCAAMMCEFLGETDIATKISDSVEKTLEFQGSTTEIGDAVISSLS
ncbi:MAG: 3-isopropylmalate dehydrogenase [Acidimicrobiia bacterium]